MSLPSYTLNWKSHSEHVKSMKHIVKKTTMRLHHLQCNLLQDPPWIARARRAPGLKCCPIFQNVCLGLLAMGAAYSKGETQE
jgi:hypothetical protein